MLCLWDPTLPKEDVQCQALGTLPGGGGSWLGGNLSEPYTGHLEITVRPEQHGLGEGPGPAAEKMGEMGGPQTTPLSTLLHVSREQFCNKSSTYNPSEDSPKPRSEKFLCFKRMEQKI